MSALVSLNSVSNHFYSWVQTPKVQRSLLIALSILMILGMVLSYALAAPWTLTASFFLLSLAPLFSFGKAADEERAQVINK